MYLNQQYSHYINGVYVNGSQSFEEISFEDIDDSTVQITSYKQNLINNIALDILSIGFNKTSDFKLEENDEKYKIILLNTKCVNIFKKHLEAKFLVVQKNTHNQMPCVEMSANFSKMLLCHHIPELMGKIENVVVQQQCLEVHASNYENAEKIHTVLRNKINQSKSIYDESCIWLDIDFDPATKKKSPFVAVAGDLLITLREICSGSPKSMN